MAYYLKTTVGNARQRGFATFVWDNNGFGNSNEQFGIFKRRQNMQIGNTYFLKGITEGAGQEYVEPANPNPGSETIEGGTLFWEGDEKMNWGEGLQLSIPSEEFEAKGKDVVMQLTYTLDFSDYNMIQQFYGDWQTNPSFIINRETIEKEYVPSNIHGANNGDVCTSNISFSESVYQEILAKGIVIQGHGLRLNKVVMATPSSIRDSRTQMSNFSHIIYNLSGQRVNATDKGIYIRNGRKYVVR